MTTRHEIKELVADAIPLPWIAIHGKQITDVSAEAPLAVIMLESGTMTGDMQGRDITEAVLNVLFIYACEDEQTEADITAAINAIKSSTALKQAVLALNPTGFAYDMAEFAPQMSFTINFSVLFCE
jgi:hypothetical protein